MSRKEMMCNRGVIKQLFLWFSILISNKISQSWAFYISVSPSISSNKCNSINQIITLRNFVSLQDLSTNAFSNNHCTSLRVKARSSKDLINENDTMYLSDDDDEEENEEDYENEDEDEMSDEELLASAGEWDNKVARYNSIHLTGRIGFKGEPKYLENGNKVVLSLTLASKRKYNSAERIVNKVDDDVTDWYGLEVWGQQAEFVSKFVDKGARVSVVGQLQVDTWIDKESNEPRSKAKVVVRDFDILESKAEADLRRNSASTSGSYNKNFKNSWKDKQEQRRPAFYTTDNDEDEDDSKNGYGNRPAGTGDFFDG